MRPLVLLSGLAEGGAERVAVALLTRLRATGHDVAACTLTDRLDAAPAQRLAEAGVERHDLGARRLLDAAAMIRYLRLLRRERFDLVHAHGQDASLFAALRRTWGGPRLVVTRHVLDEPAESLRQRIRAQLTLAALRRADAVVAVSRATAERLEALGGPGREAVTVLPNGIELERFEAIEGPSLRERVRHELGFAGEDLLILCPAVLRAGKGHEVLLEAFGRLVERGRPVHLLLAGGGPLEAELRERAAPLGDRVRVLGARDDVPRLLAACDLVALASRSEALPTALIEAAAAGRPVVATDAGGTREVVAEGETGRLVPVGDARAFSEALDRLVSRPDERRALGLAGTRRARDLFSVEVQARRTWELWKRLLEGPT